MTGPAPTLITAECFPTPALLLRTNDPVAQRTVRQFARKQAEAACALPPDADRRSTRRTPPQRAGRCVHDHVRRCGACRPRRKRGNDAAIRTFLLAAGTCLLDHPPVLVHDIDLRAYVRPAEQFVAELRAAQDSAFVPAVP